MMPIIPSIFEENPQLIGILTFIAENHSNFILNLRSILSLDSIFANHHKHTIYFKLKSVNSDFM